MSINHFILYKKVEQTINRFQKIVDFDIDLVLRLVYKTIFHDPTKNCVIKGKREDWKGFPKSKSLFYAKKNTGLPIGNLTSQLFGNIYLNDFDHFVKHTLGIKYYGRYVDDFAIIHPNKEYLKSIILIVKEYLRVHFSIELHPKKIYFQHFSKGVDWLGAAIKPYRVYIRNRTKGSFYKKIQYWNNFLTGKQHSYTKFAKEDNDQFLSSINSYLGIMANYNTYKLRKKMLKQNLSAYFWNHFYISNNYSKLVPKVKKCSLYAAEYR